MHMQIMTILCQHPKQWGIKDFSSKRATQYIAFRYLTKAMKLKEIRQNFSSTPMITMIFTDFPTQAKENRS